MRNNLLEFLLEINCFSIYSSNENLDALHFSDFEQRPCFLASMIERLVVRIPFGSCSIMNALDLGVGNFFSEFKFG